MPPTGRSATHRPRLVGLVLLVSCLIAATGVARGDGAAPLEPEAPLSQIPGFVNARTVAVSPDGTSVYAARDGRIVVYAFDAGTTDVDVVQTVEDGQGGIDDLHSIRDLVVSPDGAHLYVASFFAQGVLSVFSRDLGTGMLTFLEAQADGPGGSTGIAGLLRLAISPDGGHVYALGPTDGGVAVFARDGVTGTLTFVEAEISAARVGGGSVAVSPDGTHVYSGHYATDEIIVWDRDAVTGEITHAGSSARGDPIDIAFSPDGLHAYVTGFGLDRHTRDPVTGALTHVEWIPDTFSTDSTAISPDGLTLVSAGDDEGRTFSRDVATGALTFVEEVRTNYFRDVAYAPDGSRVFGGELGLLMLEVDPGTQAVTAVGRHQAPGDFWYRHRAGLVTADGEHMYIATDHLLTVWDRDPVTGAATLDKVHADGFGGVSGIAGARSLALSPDEAHLYVASKRDVLAYPGSTGTVAVFARDDVTGGLTFVESESAGPAPIAGLFDPHVVVSPDGLHVYVAGHLARSLSRFDRDAVTGELTYVDAVGDANWEPAWLGISPDGAHVYMPGDVTGTAFKDQTTALRVFDRDGVTGALTQSSEIEVPDVTQGGTLSPDGGHVYVTTRVADSTERPHVWRLRVYARDAGTGALSLVEEETSGKGGVKLREAAEVVVARDGSHVYVELNHGLFFDPNDPVDGIALFARDSLTGEVSFIEGVEDLDAPLISTPSGRHLYGQASAYAPSEMRAFSHGFQCAAAPMAGCRTADRGNLLVVDDTKQKSDRLTWTWKNGAPTSHGEFDPTGKHYAVCLYDSGGAPDRLLMGALVPADQECGNSGKPCWKDKVKKLTYKDPNKTPEGVSQLSLQPSTEKPQIKAKVQGRDVGWRVTPALPPTLPVRVQLQAAAGPCWEASFSFALKNDGRIFKSIAD